MFRKVYLKIQNQMNHNCARKPFSSIPVSGQVMYKNRPIENNRILFLISTLLSCEQGNPAKNRVRKFKI